MLSALTQLDIIAFAVFLFSWLAMEFTLDHFPTRRASLSSLMSRQRRTWMLAMADREMRMVDTQIIAGLQTGATFFASTSIFAIGGTFALLGATDQVLQVYRDLSVSSDVSRQLWEVRVLGLATIFVYSFFKFGWSYRLFNYCSIMIGGVANLPESDDHQRRRAAIAAAEMNIVASRHFTAGLRGIFFSLAYLGWFLGPEVLITSTIFVLAVLIRRQYFSTARLILLKAEQEDEGTVLDRLEKIL